MKSFISIFALLILSACAQHMPIDRCDEILKTKDRLIYQSEEICPESNGRKYTVPPTSVDPSDPVDPPTDPVDPVENPNPVTPPDEDDEDDHHGGNPCGGNCGVGNGNGGGNGTGNEGNGNGPDKDPKEPKEKP